MTNTINNTEFTITALGGMGDGITSYEGKTLFVPHTCKGDVVRLAISKEQKDSARATVTELVTPSPDRQEAPCCHYAQCGGCSLQHIKPEAYTHFKQGILEQILTELHVDRSILTPLEEVGRGSRRRVEFKVSVCKGVVSLGFFESRSHAVIDLAECLITDPALVALLPALRELLASFKKPGQVKAVHLTALAKGVDMVLVTQKSCNDTDRSALITFTKAHGIIRLCESVLKESARPEITCLYDSGDAAITFGDVTVTLPQNAFLQATQKGQDVITRHVTALLKNARVIADLYAGCGTYSFALLQKNRRISAYEGAREMVTAMQNAILQHDLEHQVQAQTRDLFTRPLSAKALEPFDGVVINPPRNGALPQIKELAKSKVKHIAMVSCNPATFKRDAAHLLQAGYRMVSAAAIDQFYWSGHLEIVAGFEYC
jgi:23S rRNA (uracil1939-C5)-methyltransferase